MPLLGLTLTLLVLGVLANDLHDPFATDDLAVLADLPDGRTDFHALPLFIPIRDTPFGEVVGRHLHRDPVADEDLDVVHAHLARDVRQDLDPIVQLHAKRRVRQRLRDDSIQLDRSLFGHVLCEFCGHKETQESQNHFVLSVPFAAICQSLDRSDGEPACIRVGS